MRSVGATFPRNLCPSTGRHAASAVFGVTSAARIGRGFECRGSLWKDWDMYVEILRAFFITALVIWGIDSLLLDGACCGWVKRKLGA